MDAPDLRAPGGLAETLARLARLGEDYELGLGPGGDGWIPARELVEGGPSFAQAMDRLLAQRRDAAAQRAIGSRFVQLYLRFLSPVVAAFALERRVPDVAAANLLVRLDPAGWPAGFALAEPRFAVLAGDPAAGEATAVLEDGLALSGWLNEQAIQANAGLLIETVQRRLRTSATTLWGSVAEAFARSLLWHVQHVAPESSGVVRDAEALLDHHPSPRLADQVRLLDIVEDGSEWRVAARRTCCLRWCLPGGVRCEDCPLSREPGAEDLLRTRLGEAIARGRALREDPALGPWTGPRPSRLADRN
jgi:hypothetical protein